MIGEWKGGAFDTGHPVINALDTARWFGKTFRSTADVQPLICLDDDGNKFSNTELGKGEATLWMEEFRGELIATMVYDGQPLHDHFKKVDDNTVMGIMNGKHALKTGTVRLLLPRARLTRGIAAGEGEQPVKRGRVGGQHRSDRRSRRSCGPRG